MKLNIIDLDFSVCKVADYRCVDVESPYCFTGCTAEEKSLVCPTNSVPQHTLARDDGWKAFYIEGTLDFSLIGILARISAVLAEEKIGLFAISTYNTDYILVKQEHFCQALDALAKAGYQIERKDC